MSPAIAALLTRLDIPAASIVARPEEVLDEAVAGRLALWLLDRAAVREPAAAVMAALRDLHRQELDGEPVPPARWRGLRRDSLALADHPAAAVRRAGVFAEAAAWPLAGARAGLTDLLDAAEPIVRANGIAQTGWTDDDEARATAMLEEIARSGLERSRIPARFAALDPLLERRFATQLETANAASLALRAELLAALRDFAGMAARAGDRPTPIPRAHLFGVPDRSAVQISPDGAALAWIAPVEGIANIWTAPRAWPELARALTADRHRGIHGFLWARDGHHLLYGQDRDGDEIVHVHAVSIATGENRDLTPLDGVRGFVVATSPRHPGTVVVALNDRDPAWPDLWRIDIASGERRLLCRNARFAACLLDDDLVPRVASRRREDGGITLLRPSAEGDGWDDWIDFSADDARTSGPLDVDADGCTLFLLDSRGRDTTALVAIDLANGQATLLAEDARADIGGIIADRATRRPHACFVTVERREIRLLDDTFRRDVERLDGPELGDWGITARSADDRWWTLAAGSDTRPSTYWLYDRHDGSLQLLCEGRPALAGAALSPMTPFTVQSRDGLPLVCYLTVPSGGQARPQPLVLLVHGGPWMRDHFGYHGEHQWLADRGYAVLSVNFRGSTGFGKAFLLAGNGEWGRRMGDDLDDAVDWAIAAGIADPARLAIMGTSYGGYAVLSALSRRPDRYACGIDIVGPSNLETLIAATPPHWESQRAMLHRAIGDPTTEEGRALLHTRSPLHRANRIAAPLLIGQGANDPRVPQAESDRIVAAMRANGAEVDYALFPDEGHGFVRPANAIAFRIAAEAFLARHLGGRFEPADPAEHRGSTLSLDRPGWLDPLFAG